MKSWSARLDPLAPRAVAATGSVARTLARATLSRDDDRLKALRGVAGEDVIVLLGDAEALPWVDGVVYLGVDLDAPSLLLPTALVPPAPLALFERAAVRLAGSTPVVVLPAAQRFVAVGTARPLSRSILEAVRDRLS